MKIRTLLLASVVTFSILLLIICGLVILTNQQIQNLVSQEEIANRIALEAGEIGYLSNDYLLFREPQQAERWNTKFVAVSEDIMSLSVDQPEQKAIVGNLKANLRNTRSVFDDIALNPLQPGGIADTRFVQISWSRMAVQSQGMVFDARRLATILQEESENLMRVRTLLIFSLMGVFIAFLLTSYFIFYRRALMSISLLTTGTKIIGSGDLDYMIETGTEDEIGDLSRSINRMTVDLRNVLASKKDLEREISERKRVETQLVQNNENLNALNEELTATQEKLQQNVGELSRRENELHSVALFPIENPSPTMRINDSGILLFANPASSPVIGCWKINVGEKVPDHIISSALDSLERGIMHITEEICTPFTYSIRYTPIATQNYINLYFSDITERKRIEEALRDSEEKYRLIFETANEGIWITDADRSTILVNKRMADMLGYSTEEMLGKTPSEYLAPDQEQKRLKTRENLAKGASTQTEFKLRRKDGSEIWVISRASPVFDRRGGYVRTVSLLADITDRKRAEEALRKSEGEYRHLVTYAPAAIYEISSDGLRFQRVNEAMCRILGYTREELLAMNPFDILDEESKSRFRERVRKRLSGDDIDESVAYRILGRDGREIWATLNIRINQEAGGKTLVVAHDVTERKRAEDALRQSEERYSLIYNGAPFAISLSKIPDGTYITVNKAWEELTGFSEKEAVGNTSIGLGLIPFPDDRSSTVTKLLSYYSITNREMPVITKSGVSRIVLSSAAVVTINREKCWLSIMQDITEQKEAEEALRETEQRFRLALKNSPVSVAIQDVNLVFIWAYNQRTIKPEEIIGKTDTDIFIPEDATRLIELKRKVIDTGKEAHEQIWLTMNGKRMYLDLYLEPLRNNTGHITGIGMATVDQTLEKLTNIALRDSEKRLREANDLLEAVTEATKVIIAAEDTNFRYTYFNKTYAAIIRRLTGKEIMTGMSMIDLFSDLPAEQRSELNEWSKVLTGESVNEHIIFNDSVKGKTIYNVLHVPLRDAKWEIIGAGEIAFDITLQVGVEDTLRETSQYLTNLIDYANAPIIVWDPQFRITLFNHAFEHLTGRKAKEVIGHHLEILLPENYLTQAMDLIKKTSEGERWESVEIPILHKKGGIRTVLWNSAAIFESGGKTIVATIAQGQDITDRKKIESELRIQAAEYAKMNVALKGEIDQRQSAETNLKKTLSLLNASLESTADGILVIDCQGKITSYNQNFVHMWNIPEDMVKTWDNQTIINNFQSQIKDPEKFLADMEDLLAHTSRESYDVIELTDGRIFERYSKPQKIGNAAVGRVWSYREITDRRRSEEKLFASLQEKEVLLREIHHRVKNNLQLVTGLLDMTRMRTKDESTTSILTDMMLKIQTMAQIHTRLYESKQFGKIGLTGQFRDQIAALSNIYSHKGHEISCEIHAEEIFLPVDQAIPCALVVNEILSNSYKHAFFGKKEGRIEIYAVQENGNVRITIRDNGIGMPPNFNVSSANSLGLKLVRTLVQHQLKGSLTINSLHGTETIVEFPLGIMER